ncbi:MAG: hypothetical protein ABJB34_05295 [Acidobacteriota bacterium]
MQNNFKLTTFAALIVLIMSFSTNSQNIATFSGLQTMGAKLNSANNDQVPTLSPNGLSLYLASSRSGTLGGLDIYVSQRATLGSAWGSPQSLGVTLNSSGNDAVNKFFARRKNDVSRQHPHRQRRHLHFHADRP